METQSSVTVTLVRFLYNRSLPIVSRMQRNVMVPDNEILSGKLHSYCCKKIDKLYPDWQVDLILYNGEVA
jgi:hypothetical protein